MPPSGSKANYKSFEAQARMVRAIVAAHPEVKWNYKGKKVAICYLLPLREYTSLGNRPHGVRN